MTEGLEGWVEKAAALPVAFAQVREDALLDLELVRGLNRAAPRVLLVASGGCTAAALAALPVGQLHLVDVNPAQIALSRLKLALLQSASPDERLALLGHDWMEPDRRIARLLDEFGRLGLAADVLGPLDQLALLGPDRVGRYEVLFACLRGALREAGGQILSWLSKQDLAAQAAAVAPETKSGQALDAAFDRIMALQNLIRLFGTKATANPVQPFARHFATRTRHVLATQPAADNPYLFQMFRGEFPPGVVYPWLIAPVPARLPPVSWTLGDMAEVLKDLPPESFDFVHLSNILDWLTPEEATAALDRAHRVLSPGGVVFIRQLNSSLDIPGLSSRFAWDPERARALHARDRSFFYRSLHVGRKA
jgi:S-adenosylmethionine-diacylglycerol 3-amino-3-carboxypropyl transferase